MLDIQELDLSLKLKALGRLLDTKHPFLIEIKNQLNLKNFLFPKINCNIEPTTNLAVQCLAIDRLELIKDPRNFNNRIFIGLIKEGKLSDVINREGSQSIQYLALWRSRKTKIKDLNTGDLESVRHFIDPIILNCLRAIIAVDGATINDYDRECMFINNRPIHLAKISSKGYRTYRNSIEPICIFRSGTILTPAESQNYFYKVSKLTSTRHKDILLRIIHGDIYTKERQHRFGLSADPNCPRCGIVETLEHKFSTCTYVERIWNELNRLTGNQVDPTIEPLQERIMAKNDSDPILL